MDTEQPGEYLLLMRNAAWGEKLSPREAQEGIESMMQWLEGLKARGLILAGQPLAAEGRLVSANKDGVIDGPFVESKEAVGGYFLLRTSSYQEAQDAVASCPVLKYGLIIELRPIIDQCQLAEEFEVSMKGISVSSGN